MSVTRFEKWFLKASYIDISRVKTATKRQKKKKEG